MRLYTILLFTLSLLLLPFFLLKLLIDKRYRTGLSERLGLLPSTIEMALEGKGTIWFHAASVGEVMASVKLLSAIRKRWPDKKILVSTFTAAGNRTAREKLKADAVIYIPFDIPFIVRRVLLRIKPDILIIMETEIWPNLINEVSAMPRPVVLVNGRISDSSFGRYKLIKRLLGVVFQKISLIMTQSDEYRSRFIELGAPPGKVETVGNLKVDMEMADIDLAFMDRWEGPRFIAGSTRKGEEEQILDAWSTIVKKYTGLKLVLAPRHIERAGEIEALLKSRGLRYEKRSEVNESINAPVLLVDTLGELSSLYKYGRMVFVGGSLAPMGGQNVLEPALWGRPVLFGPHMENFRDSAALLIEAGGGIMVHGSAELAKAVDMLLSDPNYCTMTGKKAKEAVLKNQGATERTLEALARFINAS